MAAKVLDEAGVHILWAKIKASSSSAQQAAIDAAAEAAGNLTVNGKSLSSSPVLTAEDVAAVPTDAKGAAGGVATLGDDGRVPTAQLPSYVDDVIEAENHSALPAEGEGGKIYITLDDNKTYRWGGSAYVEISASLAIGTTEGTAYDGQAGANLATAVASKADKTTATAEADGLMSAADKAKLDGLEVITEDEINTICQ